MKKSSIALGVAALMAGAAQAGIVQGSASTIAVNPNGIGHKLVIPYFTTQGNNATLINIVNTDRTNGKAVKVRFRGAANSDDLYDFQVLLSPGDVWTAALTQGADGRTQLTTSDNSCTRPASVNGSFLTGRLDPNSTRSLEEQTREGYVEIINMADIPVNTASGSLYMSIKHGSNGKPGNCNAAAVTALDDDNLGQASATASYTALGLDFPSTGLTADWIIINQATTAAWSGSATAFEARSGGTPAAATTANIVYFPQSGSGVSTTTAGLYSSDPLFINGDVQAAYYDFPDLSTPYINGVTSAGVYRNTLASTIARSSVINEFVTSDAIAAQTDLVFSQPLRRYYAAVTYGATAGVVRVNSVGAVVSTGEVYTSNNTALINRVLCVRRPTGSQLLAFAAFDREEQTLTPSGAVISPGTPTQFNICGEVAVTSINAGDNTQPSALSATLARNNIELPFADGWIRFNTTLDPVDQAGTAPNVVTGLPIIGNAHLRAANGAVNYGFTWPHKYNN
ncbi:hypothetical protein [Tepidimonas taiwanensis]|uniref:hypothetical protein n=1 Tax=Tepidimonas taiwanensis TaxID=307486 RepID=UPI0006912C82|nr:hypothetical protein [Tepidimonas taiwanensis]